MRQLSIDIETYSSIDIKLGVYRYVDAPDFQILLFAYAFDNEPVELIDLACGEDLPADVMQALTDKAVLKKAYNAQFERVCIGKYLGMQLDVRQWWCTMAHAAQLGLPGRLGDVAALLKLEQQKDKAGTLLINYFSKPCKPTKANGERTRNYPYHDMDKWDLFCKYCKQDVETERAIGKYLEQFPPLANELLIYREDQRINDRGIRIDMDLVDAVLEYNDLHAADLLDQSAEITGLANANSRDQLLSWIQAQGVDIPDIRKETLEALLDTEIPDPVRIVINNRLETGKASIKKYQSIKNSICADGKVHGTLRYYGASRTGRWSGQILQPQNLSKNLLPEIDAVRTLVKRKDFDTLEILYPSMSELFKQLIRTTIIASEGNTLAIADYSAIEARVIAWLAGEDWVCEVFKHDGDIYKQTASKMFGIPIDQIDKPLRQRGKVSTLALGYQGGTGALINMGALKMGVPEEDLPKLVKAWRKANPHIVRLAP
jgi:DNA polymerase bacteriophage-type